MDTQNYEKLKELLANNKKWPMKYLFKFIAPNDQEVINRVVSLLPAYGKFAFKNSKNNKYVSVSCIASMKNAQKIIDITQNVSKIPNVITL